MAADLRGHIWAVYVADSGEPFAYFVDRQAFDQEERGWSDAQGLGLVPLPRRWKPRKVQGIDASGRTQTAIVASVVAPLWAGTITAFNVEATNGEVVTATVTGRLGEKRPKNLT